MKKIYTKNLLRNCIHTFTASAELALRHCLGSHCCTTLTPYVEPQWSLGSMQTMCLVP
jgi:hypothetical protein